MFRWLILIAGLLLTTTTATAQDWAKAQLEKSTRHQEWVKVKAGTRELQGFIVYPEVKDRAVAVVVIHEIFGLSDWARGVADQLAEAGYIALAPDFLSGMAPGGGGTAEFPGRDAITKAVSSLPPEQVTADLNASIDYVAKLPACNGKVVVAGFCWGGSQTFREATNNQSIKAAYVFYGTGPDKEEDITRIQCPVYGFYGGNDARVNATIPQSTELMKKAGKIYEPVTYDGAGHGFMRAGEAPDTNEANKKAHDEAWKRWKELLKKI
ncbi:MAG TPA: dienelactone hydrolase family protein [Terriglobia bacterium]|nr:dienelactone hydrolase family protein [Terriglobia bacterium]